MIRLVAPHWLQMNINSLGFSIPPLVVQSNNWYNIFTSTFKWLTITFISLSRCTLPFVDITYVNRLFFYRFIHSIITIFTLNCTCYNIMRMLKLLRFCSIIVNQFYLLNFHYTQKTCFNWPCYTCHNYCVVYQSDKFFRLIL